MRVVAVIAVVVSSAAAVPAIRGRDLEIASVWAATPVPVDGSAGDWAALLRPLGDPPIVVGLQNDGRFLYLCVRTSDPILKRELTHAGLTVWVNGEGKDKHEFGVHYTAGPGRPGERGEPPEGEPAHRPRAGGRAEALELLGPGAHDVQRVQRGPDDPVQAAAGDDSGVLVLQFRVPLAPSAGRPLAVGAGPGATIALGLATERPQFKGGRARFGGGHWGGGGPEGGFGRRGGYGGGPSDEGDAPGAGRDGMEGGPRAGAVPVPIDVWLRVRLAAAPPAPMTR